MLKALFFDNDGVLIDTETLYFRATQEVLAGAGVTLDAEAFVEYFLRQGKGAWFLLEEKGYSADDIGRLRQNRNRLYARLLETEAILIDGVEASLRRLAGRVRMGIVTSSRRDHFDIIHRRTGILPFFDFSLTIEDYEKAKPHPAPYLMAVARSGCRPEECLVVEDSERGLRSAVAAGLRCVVVPRGMTASGHFEGASGIMRSLSEVADEVVLAAADGRGGGTG
jgi:HAD superfamily hydrolase (TIGR01509 family)